MQNAYTAAAGVPERCRERALRKRCPTRVIFRRIKHIASSLLTMSFEYTRNLFNSRTHSDITIHVGADEFFCHKFVLCSASIVFDTMLSGLSIESKFNVVEVDDIEAAIFRQLIHYIYTGEVESDIYLCNSELLYAAEKYELKNLKYQMEECFITQIDFDNITDMKYIAEMFNLKRLTSACDEFLRRTNTKRSTFYDRHEIKIISQYVFKKCNLTVNHKTRYAESLTAIPVDPPRDEAVWFNSARAARAKCKQYNTTQPDDTDDTHICNDLDPWTNIVTSHSGSSDHDLVYALWSEFRRFIVCPEIDSVCGVDGIIREFSKYSEDFTFFRSGMDVTIFLANDLFHIFRLYVYVDNMLHDRFRREKKALELYQMCSDRRTKFKLTHTARDMALERLLRKEAAAWKKYMDARKIRERFQMGPFFTGIERLAFEKVIIPLLNESRDYVYPGVGISHPFLCAIWRFPHIIGLELNYFENDFPLSPWPSCFASSFFRPLVSSSLSLYMHVLRSPYHRYVALDGIASHQFRREDNLSIMITFRDGVGWHAVVRFTLTGKLVQEEAIRQYGAYPDPMEPNTVYLIDVRREHLLWGILLLELLQRLKHKHTTAT